VLDDAKILSPHAEHGGAVDFGLPSDEVGLLRVKFPAFLVLPCLFGVVSVVEKDGGGVPVELFLRHEGAALKNEDFLAGLGEL
jgi:hypothetical protein